MAEEYKYRITQKGQSLVLDFNFDHTGILLEVPSKPYSGGLLRNAIRDNLPDGVIDAIDDLLKTKLVYHFGALTDMNDMYARLDKFLTEHGFTKVPDAQSSGKPANDLPASFVEALKEQVAEQYKVIIRYRALKNDTIDEETREKQNKEIQLRLRNIKEIQENFLEQVELKDADSINLITFEVIEQLDKNAKANDKTTQPRQARLQMNLNDLQFKNKLVKVLSELYEQGPEQDDIWKRAGGDVSILTNSSSRKSQWYNAIDKLSKGGGGRGITIESLLNEVRNDFPDSDFIKGLFT